MVILVVAQKAWSRLLLNLVPAHDQTYGGKRVVVRPLCHVVPGLAHRARPRRASARHAEAFAGRARKFFARA